MDQSEKGMRFNGMGVFHWVKHVREDVALESAGANDNSECVAMDQSEKAMGFNGIVPNHGRHDFGKVKENVVQKVMRSASVV